MGKLAFLYAGQGSQHVGMGKDLYETFPEYKSFINSLNLDFDVKKMCFENADGRLDQTEFTQPCMVALACGINQILQRYKVKPDYVCGLSLGEYSALNMAEVWDAEKTVEIAAYRGKVMAQASVEIETSMMAIIGLTEEQVRDCCVRAASYGVVSPCNFNCPGQIVISGEKDAVKKASNFAKEMGAKKRLPLNVSGPFHTSLMKPAGDALRRYFETVTFHEPLIEVLYNCFGGPLGSGISIPQALVRQVQQPVYMENIITYLFQNDVENFVEIGPGTTLSGFIRKTAQSLHLQEDSFAIYTLETAEDLQQFINGIELK